METMCVCVSATRRLKQSARERKKSFEVRSGKEGLRSLYFPQKYHRCLTLCGPPRRPQRGTQSRTTTWSGSLTLEIADSIPPHMPRPAHVAEQIAAGMIVSGQVRMNIWELLCGCRQVTFVVRRVPNALVESASAVAPTAKARSLV